MDILSAAYNQFGGIDVVVQGQKPDTMIVVPDDMANKDRQALAEWEAEGNTITPFKQVVPPDYNNYDAMLERRQNAALDAGDTDLAFKIMLQRQE